MVPLAHSRVLLRSQKLVFYVSNDVIRIKELVIYSNSLHKFFLVIDQVVRSLKPFLTIRTILLIHKPLVNASNVKDVITTE